MLNVDVKQGKKGMTQRCVADMYLTNLGFRGFLGVTAGNQDSDLTKVELVKAQLFNTSP
jgi:hypothetical protein